MRKKTLILSMALIGSLMVSTSIFAAPQVYNNDVPHDQAIELNSNDEVAKSSVIDISDNTRGVIKTYQLEVGASKTKIITEGLELSIGEIDFLGVWTPRNAHITLALQQKVNGTYKSVHTWAGSLSGSNRSLLVREEGIYRIIITPNSTIKGSIQLEFK